MAESAAPATTAVPYSCIRAPVRPGSFGFTPRRITAALLAALALALSLLFSVGAGPAAAARLDVVVWGQKDARWASLHLDDSFRTMGGSGCAVTSAAMVAAYYGSTKNPGQLCQALNANGGLDSQGSIDFARVPRAAGGSISFVGWHTTDLALLNRELDAGHPIIAQVTLPGGLNHFVVITGRNTGTYSINDPWYNDTSTINARYGTPASAIHSIIIYHGTVPVPAALTLVGSVGCPSGPYLRGDRVPVVFTLKNSGGRTGTWSPLVLALRDPAGANRDVVAQSTLTLAPGASGSFTAYLPLDSAGTWTGWVSGQNGGQWVNPGGKPTVTITATEPVVPAGQRFSDVPPADPNFPAIETMAELGVLAGYPQSDGSTQFHPTEPLLRAQIAKLACEAFGLKVDETMTSAFTDLGPDDPADLYPNNYVAAANLAQIIQGKSTTIFDPWSNVTRAQMVTIMVRAIQQLFPQRLQAVPAPFLGALGNFDATHAANMRLAEYNGLLQGIVGFGPQWDPWAPAGRAEVAQFLYRWKLKSGV